MSIFNLAKANIKHNKSATLSLIVLILIAAMMLHIGLMIMTQMTVFYKEKVEELGDAHISVITRSESHSEQYRRFFEAQDNVELIEMQEGILLEGTKFRYVDKDMEIPVLLLNAEAERTISPFKLAVASELEEGARERSIYLPYTLKADAGYKLGDKFTLQGLDQEFRIAGFFETTMFGTNHLGLFKLLVPDAAYRLLADELGHTERAVILSVWLTDIGETSKLNGEFERQHSQLAEEGGDPYRSLDVLTAEYSSMITVNIVAMILVAFALVMILVALIVIKFRVTNSIEDGMVNIGVLKAMGYTTRQIAGSLVLQYMLITCLAGVAGVALSYTLLPATGELVASLSSLIWVPAWHLTADVLSLLVVIVLVMAVTGFAVLRIRKLFPVTALRGGIMTHSFRKNYLPLDRTRGGLTLLLAGKTITSLRKPYLTIALIVTAVTFASVFVIVLYYNIAVNHTAFIELTGEEISDVMVIGQKDADGEELMNLLEGQEEVTKVNLWDGMNVQLDGQNVFTYITDDYRKLEKQEIYKGRYPVYDNELAITWLVAEQLGKDLGDTVEVKIGNITRTYLITGLHQSLNNMGLLGYMTLSGVQEHMPGYEVRSFNVHLEPAVDNESFISRLKVEYDHLFAELINIEEMVAGQMNAYTSIVLMVTVAILAITVLVVVLILYLLIKTMIIKRKREYGIQMANGFTTWQLMNQIALSFMPVVMLGVLIGGLLGSFYTNELLSVLLSGAGVKKVDFTIDPVSIVMLCGGLILLAYIISMLASRRIGRISPYELITE